MQMRELFDACGTDIESRKIPADDRDNTSICPGIWHSVKAKTVMLAASYLHIIDVSDCTCDCVSRPDVESHRVDFLHFKRYIY